VNLNLHVIIVLLYNRKEHRKLRLTSRKHFKPKPKQVCDSRLSQELEPPNLHEHLIDGLTYVKNWTLSVYIVAFLNLGQRFYDNQFRRIFPETCHIKGSVSIKSFGSILRDMLSEMNSGVPRKHIALELQYTLLWSYGNYDKYIFQDSHWLIS